MAASKPSLLREARLNGRSWGVREFVTSTSAKAEAQPGAVDRDVLVLERRQAVGVVGLRVFFIAHANRGALQQTNGGSQHLLSRHAAQRQIVVDPFPDRGEHRPKRCHAAEFRGVAHGPVVRMVAVLFAPASIASDRLQMPTLETTDPNVRPRRRNHKAPNPFQDFCIFDEPVFGIQVTKTAARPLSYNPRRLVRDVAQTCNSRRFIGISG